MSRVSPCRCYKLIATPISAPSMMTSSNWNIFRVTGPFGGEFAGHRWIPLAKASDTELRCFFDLCLNGWANHQDAADLRHHRAHYDVTVMINPQSTHKYARSKLIHKRFEERVCGRDAVMRSVINMPSIFMIIPHRDGCDNWLAG